MENIACVSQSLEKVSTVPNRTVRATTVRAFLACAALICFSSLAASAIEPTIQQLFSFPCPTQQSANCPQGYAPNRLIQASDGNFYGAAQLTTEGTSTPQGGTLFKITPTGQFTLLFTFTADGHGNYLNGDNPASSLVEANDGFLYGTTFDGGINNDGVLFRIGKNGKGFQVVHSFCAETNCADGATPLSLTLGHDGHLYGVTAGGGEGNVFCCGTIFRFTPSAGFTSLFAFNGTTQGGDPRGIIQGADGNFYGAAGNEIFRFTASGELTILASFPLVDGVLPTSADSGLTQASNGKLYGSLITYSINQAQFYEINPAGTGFHEFPAIGTLAVDFVISNLIQASDGNLWTAFNQKSDPNGSVVAISPTTGAVVQNIKFEGPNGSLPEAGIVQGADGKLYGTTAGGGIVGGGQQASGTVWVVDAGLAAPASVVAGFAPSAGAVGAKVLIRGSHFIGATAVKFNGVNATFTVLNTNFISVTVPAGAISGSIAVTNAGGTTVSAGHFIVQ